VLTAEKVRCSPSSPCSRKGTKQPEPCPAWIYRHRNLIERCWARLKERRAIATRYDKTATSYAAGIAIAATLDWFKLSMAVRIRV
jgi:transposase